MEVHVRNCPGFDLAKFIQHELKSAVWFKAATAYLTKRGLDLWSECIQGILHRRGRVEVVHAADCFVTEPAAIHLLSSWALDYSNMKYRVDFDWSPIAPKFHPKMYLCSENYRSHLAVVGSSNWTRRGLSENIEINTIIRGSAKDEPIAQSHKIFETIINNDELIQPDGEWIRRYKQVYTAIRSLSRSSSPSPEVKQLIAELESYKHQEPTRNLETQLDYVVKTMMELERKESRRDFSINEIITASMVLAQTTGGRYKWNTWHNSIRRVLNTNTVSPTKGLALFVRVKQGCIGSPKTVVLILQTNKGSSFAAKTHSLTNKKESSFLSLSY